MGYIIIIIIMQVLNFIPSSLILSLAEISTAKNTKISGLNYLKRKTQGQDLWNKDNTENHASFVAVGIGCTPLPSPRPLSMSASTVALQRDNTKNFLKQIFTEKVPIFTFMCL